MPVVYLLLGANLGEREVQLYSARNAIAGSIGQITVQSSVYETASWGNKEEQPDFLNQAIGVLTGLTAEEVLEEINRIEARLGRVRKERWDARIIDIDILFYDRDLVDLPHLQIPHRYFQERNFAMVPMNEIAPDLVHPSLGKTVKELLSESKDPLEVRLYESELSFKSELP